MTCLAFEAALREPDHAASNAQLQDLIAAADYSGHTLPTVAQEYLRAFCNTNLSHTRRRWIGIALARMLGTSPEVVKHFSAVEQQLQGLGDVILSTTEREETRVVAGIIVQQALEHHVEFASFWTSDKVRNSAPNFPDKSGPRWMNEFQSFLDTLGDLALANPITDPIILYPVSVVASDSLQWASADKGKAVAIVQHDVLTILLPDASLREVQFLDVPIAHIHSTSTRPSAPLHDSQSRQTSHEPWDLVLTLKPTSGTYLFNASKRTATELIVLFAQSVDAEECETSIRELQRSSKGGIAQPSDLLLDINPLPPHTSGDARQQQQAVEILPSDASHGTQRRVCRSSPIVIKRRRQPVDSQSELEQSSDPLNKSPSTRPHSTRRSPDQVPVAEPPERSRLVSNRNGQTTKQKDTELAQKQNDVADVWVADCVETVQSQETPDPVQDARQVEARQAQRRVREPQDKKHTRSTRQNKAQAHVQTVQTSSGRADSSNSIASPSHSTTSVPTSSKQTHGNGKLPKVSQATKQRTSQRVSKQPDVFEIPGEGPKISGAKEDVSSHATPTTGTESRTKLKKTKITSRAMPSNSLGRKTRSKRRAEEGDDEFVPNATKKITTKRKSVAEATITHKPLKKKAKIGYKAAACNASSLVRTSPGEAGVQHVSDAAFESEDGMVSQRSKSTSSEKPHLPAAVSRTPLIGGLLGLQKPQPTPDAAFKRPALPPRAHNTPSTPKQRRVMPAIRPQTPIVLQKTPNSHVASSPPLNGMEDGGFGLHSDAGEVEMILSSNSKPIPASPHAESTAISGHADCDDVDLEKRQGEIQTARLDPFQQRRREGQKATSFIRRLTGDMAVDDAANLAKSPPHPALAKINVPMSSETEERLAKASYHFASQPEPDNKERHNVVHARACVSQPSARTSKDQKTALHMHSQPAAALVTSNRPSPSGVLSASHSSKRKAVERIDEGLTPRKRSALASINNNQVGRFPVAAKKVALVYEGKVVDVVDSVHEAVQEVVDDTQSATADEPQHDFDGDTFVNDGSEEQLPTRKASDPFFCSSPPDMPGTPSSHSSTSAALESSSPAPTVPTSEAEAEEWEASLQPHQRALHDLLMRVSKRVLRHVVDNETAVTDIAETFATDGTHMLEKLLDKHDNHYKGRWKDLDAKRTALQGELESSARALARERKRVSAMT
jgi:hypothetical protein